MSAAGRGGKRREGDWYATPAGAVRAVLPHLPRGRIVLDPGCGEGAIMRVVADDPSYGGSLIRGVEIHEARAQAAREATDRTVYCASFTGHRSPPWSSASGIDLVIGNPPYSLALEFALEALRLAAGVGGTVALLLRLAFLEASSRVEFHRAHPADVYVLTPRPSFTGDGGSDMSAYAWFVWGPGRTGHVRPLPWDKPKRELA